jgi:hypothetical protein
MLDVALLLKIAEEIDVVQKDCWRNAVVAFLNDERFQSGLYVEGWAIPDNGLPLNLEHGWIEQPDGSIIDPTWAKLAIKTYSIFLR